MDKDDVGLEQIGRKALVDLIHDDVQHYDNLVRDHLSRIQQLILTLFTVAGIAGTLLYGYHQYVVLLAIPVAGCIMLFVMANLTGEMFALAAHKYFLEQILSRILKEALPADLQDMVPPPWDSAGGRISRRSIAYKAIQASGILALIIVSVITIAIAWVKMRDYWWLAPITAALTLVLLFVALLSYAQAVLAYGQTLTALKERGNVRKLADTDPKAAKGRYGLAQARALIKGGADEDWES